MNCVDQPRTSTDGRDVVWAPQCRDCLWAVAGFGRFFIDLSLLREQSPWSFSGLDSCVRAHLLRLWCTTTFPPIFVQLRKGPLWSCAELLQAYALCSSDQCRTENLRLPAVRELFWVMLGRGNEGWRGIGVSKIVYNEVLALKVRNVVWLRRTEETCRASSLYNGSSRVRCYAVVPSVLACVHMYILYVCVYICVCVYMCMCADMYICMSLMICMCVCICTSMHLYTCVCVRVCIFVHRLWVLVSVLQRVDGVMHAHVFSCAYVCVHVCVWVYIYVYFLQWVSHALFRCFGH